ncbi:hypothetical protein BT63DRAFT_456169 [Microthyrium microscopicum]|uniref:Uncharacterized protein n=1 Tax=Microthyrium microscopicum TaxID=703497 RepID=A0A6A6UAQ7_9PEZI|nr:hypothetical protein BT63DRAFT_456169 [Microthyrium microscopicum]
MAEAKNKYVYISSFKTTQLEIKVAFEEATGEKWAIKEISGDEILVQANEDLKKGKMSAVMDIIRNVAFGRAALSDFKGPIGSMALLLFSLISTSTIGNIATFRGDQCLFVLWSFVGRFIIGKRR